MNGSPAWAPTPPGRWSRPAGLRAEAEELFLHGRRRAGTVCRARRRVRRRWWGHRRRVRPCRTGGMPAGRGRRRGHRRSGRLCRQSKRMYPGCSTSGLSASYFKGYASGAAYGACAPAPARAVQSSPCREKAARNACRLTTLRRGERRRRPKGVARNVGLPVHHRAGRSTGRLRCADVLAGTGAVQIPLASGGRSRHRLALEGPITTVVPREPCRATHGLSLFAPPLRGTDLRDQK